MYPLKLSLLFLYCISCYSTAFSQNINDGLVIFYPFDGNLEDASGNQNHGFTGYPEFVQDRRGKKRALKMKSDFIMSTKNALPSLNTFTISIWFKTSSQIGGKIIGFESNQTTQSESYDRHVYMEKDGRLTFGIWPRRATKLTSIKSFNDNRWHFLAAVHSPDEVSLYIDGIPQRTAVYKNLVDYHGYWRIGSGTLTRWSNFTGYAMEGAIDEVRVYNRGLSRKEMDQLFDTNEQTTKPEDKKEFHKPPIIQEDGSNEEDEVIRWTFWTAVLGTIGGLLGIVLLIIQIRNENKKSSDS